MPAAPGGAPYAPPAPRSAHAGAGALARLALALGAGRLRQGKDFDAGATINAWAHTLLNREGASQIDASLFGKHVSLVANHAQSRNVLSRAPNAGVGRPAKAKIEAMSFLAPRALTIAHDEAWTLLRLFNERVVGTAGPHPYAQAFLGHTRNAFATRPRRVDDIRDAMGKAMAHIVLGDSAAIAPEIAHDVTALFGVVRSPVKRTLLGWRYTGKRDHLYAVLARAWEGARPDDESLIALAKRVAPSHLDRETMLQQVPHWMFTFTGSGTDLLVRTLALVTSNPGVHHKALGELRSAGPLDRADTVEGLPYLQACLLEAGRLFPPVTRTFHAHASAGKDATIVHWFPLLHRDDRLGPTVNAFRPERWLGDELDAAAGESNLFLRGPRACPGMHLILFVCKAALARLLIEQRVVATLDRLASDPLPVSFPKRPPRFTVSEESR
jgi:cytochrome P450